MLRTRLAAMLAAGTMLTAGLVGTAPAATAVPVPPEYTLYLSNIGVGQNPNLSTVDSIIPFFDTNSGLPMISGTVVTASFSSCGQVVQVRDHPLTKGNPASHKSAFIHYFNVDNTFPTGPNPITDKIGRSIEYDFTIHTPGYDPYTLTGSYSHYTVKRPSCEKILSGGGGDGGSDDNIAITVSKWSAKKGVTKAKVGKRLAVTPTRANGATVTYAWKVGRKVVDRDRYLKVKKAYRGKPVTMRVTVSKPGAKSVSQVLRYGKAR